MADNPFAQFAPPPGTTVDSNPFSQFAQTKPLEITVTRDAPKDFGIDFSRPVEEVRAAIGKLPAEQRKPALDAWATSYVTSEGRTGKGAENYLRALARGTPVGSWLDEANSITVDLAHKLTSGAIGAPREEALAYNRARDRQFDEQNPLTSLGLKVVGGVGSAVALPLPAVAGGASMLSKIGAAGLTGAGYGAVYGAGEGEDMGSRATEAAKGAGIGAGIGVGAVLAAAGIGNAAKYVADKYRNVPPQLAGMDRRAIAHTSDAMAADGLYQANGGPMPPGYVSYAQKANKLGPEGTLADMGDNLMGDAAALANMPGRGQKELRDMFYRRSAGAQGRVGQTVDEVIGPEQNLVRVGKDVTKAANDAAGPLYDQFYQTPIKISENLYGILDRAKEAIPGAQKLMARKGFDPEEVFYKGYPNSGVNNSGLNPRFLDYLKREVDDLAKKAAPGTEERDAWSSIARDLRNEVDSILSPDPKDLTQSVWAQARRLSGEGKAFNEALTDGQSVLNRNVHPDVLAEELKGMAPVEQAGTLYGVRGQIRNTMGNATSPLNTAEQNVAAARDVRKLISSDYGREKLDNVLSLPVAAPGPARSGMPLGFQNLGNGNTGQLLNRLDAETAFANTQQTALGNSVTARRAETMKAMGPVTGKQAAAEAGKKGPTGIATEYVWRAANAMLGGHLDARQASKAVDIARMLSTQGADRDKIASALMRYGRSREITTQGKEAIARLAKEIIESPRFAFIDGSEKGRAAKP